MFRMLGLTLLASLGLAACGVGDDPPADRAGTGVERVVLVTIDTLRADHVGSYGAGPDRTPTLDALALAGTRFETAISPAPLTAPSHASLFTGRNPPEHGLRNNSTFRIGEEATTLAERFQQAGHGTAAFVGAVVLDRQYGLIQGFDVYDDAMSGRRASPSGFQERRADAVVDAALGWLDDAPSRFFLWVHLYDPHAKYDAPQAFQERLPDDPYAAEILFADAEVGRLLQRIDERFPTAGTLMVVTSDHGESLGEHAEDTHAIGVYDATQRVPLLFRGPGVPVGVARSQVRLIDVAPTLLDLVGLPALPNATGRSLVPLLHGESLPPAAAYLETVSPQLIFGWSPIFGLRTEAWKLVRAPHLELYDLRADPDELRNLATEHTDTAMQLAAELDAVLASAETAAPGLELDEAQRARLASLGYVDSGAGPSVPAPSSPEKQRELLNVVQIANALVANLRGREALAALHGVEGGGMVVPSLRARAALLEHAYEFAERSAREAIARSPEHAQSHTELGWALVGQQRLQEAHAAFEIAAGLDPASAIAVAAQGRLAEARGWRAEARALYERALTRRNELNEGRWRLAALHVEDGRDEDATALLALVPDGTLLKPAAAVRLAQAEHRVGRTDAARRRLREALELRPGDAELEAALASLD